jgi:hypothetical protein
MDQERLGLSKDRRCRFQHAIPLIQIERKLYLAFISHVDDKNVLTYGSYSMFMNAHK